ncbi:MAG: hypothetical protein SH818_00680 [Saprospiraceae bacterium]|nr:hypothetical protein [Saprospiraceae bacterium]
MDSEKQKLLEEAHQNYLEWLTGDYPLENIGDVVALDVSGYGTALDEKILSINDLLPIFPT